jgi:hypothetical protein
VEIHTPGHCGSCALSYDLNVDARLTCADVVYISCSCVLAVVFVCGSGGAAIKLGAG